MRVFVVVSPNGDITVTSNNGQAAVTEIPIPEGSKFLRVWPFPHGVMNTPGRVDIPLPQPKKKVKKWQYMFINQGVYGRSMACVSAWMTDDEAAQDRRELTKIPETETEVEL